MNNKNVVFRDRHCKIIQKVIILAGALPPLYFALQGLSGVPLVRLVNSATEKYIAYTALTIYLAAWVRGTMYDLEMIRKAIASPPSAMKSIGGAIVSTAFLITFFLTMCMYVGRWPILFRTLLIFWTIDAIAWRLLLVPALRPEFENARKRLGGMELANTIIIEKHILGSWRVWRYLVGLVIILCMMLLSQYTKIPEYIVRRFSFDGVGVVMALAFLVYTLIVESWIWHNRIKLSGSVEALKDFSAEYKISLSKNR